MSLEVARRTFADRRRGLVYWILGLASYVAMMVAFFPTIHDQAEQFNKVVATYPKAMMTLFTGGGAIDFGSPADFLNTYLYASMVPIAVLALAIGFGAASIAGEEDAGTLDLLLSYPVRRRSVVVQKALVLVLEVLAVGVMMILLVLAGRFLVDLEVPIGNLVLATTGLVLLGSDFGLIALALSAGTGKRGMAAGLASAIAAGMYLVNSMSSVANWIEPFRFVSLFYYAAAENPLANGLALWRMAVLVIVGLVAVAAAVVSFERRDLHG